MLPGAVGRESSDCDENAPARGPVAPRRGVRLGPGTALAPPAQGTAHPDTRGAANASPSRRAARKVPGRRASARPATALRAALDALEQARLHVRVERLVHEHLEQGHSRRRHAARSRTSSRHKFGSMGADPRRHTCPAGRFRLRTTMERPGVDRHHGPAHRLAAPCRGWSASGRRARPRATPGGSRGHRGMPERNRRSIQLWV